jgi:hypothetical protein
MVWSMTVTSRNITWVCMMLVCLSLAIATSAQAPDACPSTLETSLEEVNDLCDALDRDQVCYGNRRIDITTSGDRLTFDEVGDIVDLSQLEGLTTYRYDPTTGDWGVAVLKVQADLPDTVPGQVVTFLLTGGVNVEERGAENTAPMQTFTFSTSIGSATCRNTPDALTIQTPTGVKVTFNINGIDVELGSTAVLFTQPDESVDILLVGGKAVVRTQNAEQIVPAGQFTSVALADDGAEAPSEPQAYDPAQIEGIPFNLLPNTVTVPSTDPWTTTNITLQAGQTFHISANGSANQCGSYNPNCTGNRGIDVYTNPAGNSAFETCAGQYGPCQLNGVFYGALVGQVGDGAPFFVGTGGTFTADASGTLQLGYNDHRFDDNVGAYQAIITVNAP